MSLYHDILKSLEDGNGKILLYDEYAAVAGHEGSEQEYLDILYNILIRYPDYKSAIAEAIKVCTPRLVITTFDSAFLDDNAVFPKNVFDTNNFRKQKLPKIRAQRIYRQRTYNLVAEESAGYAGLFVQSKVLGKDNSKLVMDHVLELIGGVQIDPVRALDLFLDINQQNIMMYKDFLKLYHESPWCTIKSFENSFDACFQLSWMREPGSKSFSRLLGFKLLHSSDEQLFLLIAILSKCGIINITDIWEYLSPEDSSFKVLKGKWEDELYAESDGTNALQNTGAIGDEGDDVEIPDTIAIVEKREEIVVGAKNNQKVQLLRALLNVGALSQALYILQNSIFTFLVQSEPEIADLLNLIISESIAEYYDSIYISKDSKPLSNFSESKKVLYRFGLISNEVYFYDHDDFTSNIPITRDFESFNTFIIPLLKLVGSNLARSSRLFCKICQIAAYLAKHDDIQTAKYLLRSILAPASCKTGYDPTISKYFFALLQLFPWAERYEIYGELLDKTFKRSDLKPFIQQTTKEMKKNMRRITVDNHRTMGRDLAKVTDSNPLIAWTVALNQIESYENIVVALVEAAQHVSELAYDMLNFVLLNNLTKANRDQLQEDGRNLSQWYQSLISFAAKVYKRHSAANVVPILDYINVQLERGSVVEIFLLQELITGMTGITLLTDMNDVQTRALAASSMLKRNALTLFMTNVSLGQNSHKRLMKSLIDENYLFKFPLRIAQICGRLPYEDNIASFNLKLRANAIDVSMNALQQYLEFLELSLTDEEYSSKVPDIRALLQDFKVAPNLAFTLYRRVLKKRMNFLDAAYQKDKLDKGLIKDDILQNGENKITSVSQADLEEEDEGEIMEAENHNISSSTGTVSSELHDHISDFFKSSNIAFVSIEFFCLFWSLDLYDLYVHEQSYADMMKPLKALSESKGSESKLNDAKSAKDKLTILETELSKHRVRVDRVQREIKFRKVDYFANSPSISSNDEGNGSTLQSFVATNLVNTCILPRMQISTNDARYCVQMLMQLHKNNVPNFSLLNVVDCIFSNRIADTLFTLSVQQAEAYGHLLLEILIIFNAWREDSSKYQKEGLGVDTKRNASANLHISLQKNWKSLKVMDNNPQISDLLTHQEFCAQLLEWYRNIFFAMRYCFNTKNYQYIINMLAVLERLLPVFPKLSFIEKILDEKLNELIRNDARKDLALRAQIYSNKLSVMYKDAKLLSPQDFKNDSSKRRDGETGRFRSAGNEQDKSRRRDNINDVTSSTDRRKNVGLNTWSSSKATTGQTESISSSASLPPKGPREGRSDHERTSNVSQARQATNSNTENSRRNIQDTREIKVHDKQFANNKDNVVEEVKLKDTASASLNAPAINAPRGPKSVAQTNNTRSDKHQTENSKYSVSKPTALRKESTLNTTSPPISAPRMNVNSEQKSSLSLSQSDTVSKNQSKSNSTIGNSRVTEASSSATNIPPTKNDNEMPNVDQQIKINESALTTGLPQPEKDLESKVAPINSQSKSTNGSSGQVTDSSRDNDLSKKESNYDDTVRSAVVTSNSQPIALQRTSRTSHSSRSTSAGLRTGSTDYVEQSHADDINLELKNSKGQNIDRYQPNENDQSRSRSGRINDNDRSERNARIENRDDRMMERSLDDRQRNDTSRGGRTNYSDRRASAHNSRSNTPNYHGHRNEGRVQESRDYRSDRPDESHRPSLDRQNSYNRASSQNSSWRGRSDPQHNTYKRERDSEGYNDNNSSRYPYRGDNSKRART